ncbi:hypothetical protein [Flavobacterium sp.]
MRQFENLKIYQEAFSLLSSPDCNGNNFDKVIAVKSGNMETKKALTFRS